MDLLPFVNHLVDAEWQWPWHVQSRAAPFSYGLGNKRWWPKPDCDFTVYHLLVCKWVCKCEIIYFTQDYVIFHLPWSSSKHTGSYCRAARVHQLHAQIYAGMFCLYASISITTFTLTHFWNSSWLIFQDIPEMTSLTFSTVVERRFSSLL